MVRHGVGAPPTQDPRHNPSLAQGLTPHNNHTPPPLARFLHLLPWTSTETPWCTRVVDARSQPFPNQMGKSLLYYLAPKTRKKKSRQNDQDHTPSSIFLIPHFYLPPPTKHCCGCAHEGDCTRRTINAPDATLDIARCRACFHAAAGCSRMLQSTLLGMSCLASMRPHTQLPTGPPCPVLSPTTKILTPPSWLLALKAYVGNTGQSRAGQTVHSPQYEVLAHVARAECNTNTNKHCFPNHFTPLPRPPPSITSHRCYHPAAHVLRELEEGMLTKPRTRIHLVATTRQLPPNTHLITPN